ncbi:hypothetical protein ACOSQ4_022274 [Xanthoceras sorbifolium]
MEQLFYGPCFFFKSIICKCLGRDHDHDHDDHHVPETQQIDQNYSTPEAESEMKFTEDKYGMEYSSTRAVKGPRKPPPTPIGSKKFKTQHVDTNSTSKAEGEMKLTAVEIDVRKPRTPPGTPIGAKDHKPQHVNTNSTSKVEGEMKLTTVEIDERKPRTPPRTPIGAKDHKPQHVNTNSTSKAEGEMKLTAVAERKSPGSPSGS